MQYSWRVIQAGRCIFISVENLSDYGNGMLGQLVDISHDSITKICVAQVVVPFILHDVPGTGTRCMSERIDIFSLDAIIIETPGGNVEIIARAIIYTLICVTED